MLEMLLTALLAAPLYPLNPVEQDTLPAMNLHVAAGMAAPNELTAVNPVLSMRGEWLMFHPIVMRPSLEYRFGNSSSNQWPEGYMHQVAFSLDMFAYRGTDRWTGYIGAGAVWAVNKFSLGDAAADSLLQTEELSDVSMDNSFGYRLTLGVRYRQVYSVEVNIVELESRMNFTSPNIGGVFRTYSEKVDLGDFRVSVGYLFNLYGH